MKVCFITGEYPPMRGGVADYTGTLAHSLYERGAEPCIITSTRAVQEEPASFPVFPAIDKWGFGAWRRIQRSVREFAADIVHIQYQTAAYGMHPAVNLLPFWLHRRLTCRVVCTLHDLREPYLFPRAGALRSWVNARLIDDSDAAITTNAEDLQKAKRLAPDASISLIPIASSIPLTLPADYDREALRSGMGVGAGDCLVSYFGMLNQSKGIEFLLSAMRQLLDDGLPVKLLMLGEEVGDADPTNRGYREKILAVIETLGLNEAVLRTGYLPAGELSAHLCASDMCVLPFVDGASFRRTSLLAALERGLPIISTQGTAGGPTGLVSGESCLLVPPRDADALAKNIEKLISSPSLRDHLGRGALALSKDFSWERIAEQTMRLYSQLMTQAT